MGVFHVLLLSLVACSVDDSPVVGEAEHGPSFFVGGAPQHAEAVRSSASFLVPAMPAVAAEQGRLDERAIPIVVRTTLAAAFEQAGLGDQQLDALDGVFIERLDLHAQLPAGAVGTLFFVGANLRGVVLQPAPGAPVVAAAFVESRTDPAGFYDADGFSLRGDMLARPVPLSRITSTFGHRLHPITGELKAHEGTDFGAPVGTRILAIADGVIARAATGAAAGNHVQVQHDGTWQSRYLHMSRIAPNIRTGAKVKKGQWLGDVGSTGLSTGPHLHFELRQGPVALDSRYVFPRPSTALTPSALARHIPAITAYVARHRQIHQKGAGR